MFWIAGVAAALLVAILALLVAWRARDAEPPVRSPRIAPVLPDYDVGRWLLPEGDDAAPAGGDGDGEATRRVEALTPEQARALLREVPLRVFALMPPDPATLPAAEGVQAGIAASVAATLARLDADARHVPRRPQLLPQLTRAINDPRSTAQSIAGILGQDPALAANLLRVANSVAYRRRPEPMENLERAVALLGNDGLRQIVMAALLQPVIDDDGSVLGRCAVALWEHTLLAAAAAAGYAADSGEDPHAAQLLALLHGLGSVVVVQVLRDAYARRVAVAPDGGVVAGLLDAWAAPVALRISSGWAISERTRQALAAFQPFDAGADEPLLVALRHGRLAAALQLHAAGEPAPAAEPQAGA